MPEEGLGTRQGLPDGPSVVRLGPRGDMSIRSITLQEGGFQEKHTSPNYASDFYPRVIITNMFTDLIICIFSLRVTPLEGSLLPRSTVLTKCLHIFPVRLTVSLLENTV